MSLSISKNATNDELIIDSYNLSNAIAPSPKWSTEHSVKRRMILKALALVKPAKTIKRMNTLRDSGR